MLQGTGSNVGKSLLVAGLCRAYARRGLAVRPFKPQNMSNNAAVTPDGREIGRAQALQARAACIPADVDMNPVLLKPQTEHGAQVVVQGGVIGNADARAYHTLKPQLMPRVLESFERLGRDADLVLVEGAGSPAEVNLREGDIANMGFACEADVPVVLVGDVDRGGVIASLVGTAALLPAAERTLTKGFMINKFRGDPSLFDDATTAIAERTGWAPLGLVPWFDAAPRLPSEDSASLDSASVAGVVGARTDAIKIAVPRLPRIANFDDLDPLGAEPDVVIELVSPGEALPGDADLVLLPGSKATRADLETLRREGWALDIQAHVRRGGWVIGVCGGYQMLGRRVDDPVGIEGAPGETKGLGLLEIDTVLGEAKQLAQVTGQACEGGDPVSGYEMHMGETFGPDTLRPLLTLSTGPDGARSADGRVMGCYLHGLFASDGFRHRFLNQLRHRNRSGVAFEAVVEQTLDALGAHLETHLDLDGLLVLARAR
jgi:adenosylcobyric acid synthase